MTGGTNSFAQEFIVEAHADGDPSSSSPIITTWSAETRRIAQLHPQLSGTLTSLRCETKYLKSSVSTFHPCMAAEGGGALTAHGMSFDTGGESWSRRVDNVNAERGSSGEGERKSKEHEPRAEDLDNALFRSLRPGPRSSKTPFGPLKTQARVRVTHPPLVCGQATGNAARGEADTAAGF